MIASLARLISTLFNPAVLFLVIPFLLLLNNGYSLQNTFVWIGYTIGFMISMIVFVYLMVKRKVFTDMDISRREQRPLMFVVSAALIVLYVGGLLLFDGPRLLFAIAFGIMLGVLLGSLVNTKIKASIHVASAVSLIGAVAFSFGGYYLLLLLLIPLVAWSRIVIKRHTLYETLAGGLLGILLLLSVYLFYTNVLLYL